MTKTDDFMYDDDLTDIKVSGAAPDWGHRYGIKELWSEIKPGLYMGGTGDNDTILDPRPGSKSIEGMINVYDHADITSAEFDAVVTMYAWARPVEWFVEEYRWGIFDSRAVAPDPETVKEVVTWAHKRWTNDKNTLIRCQAGLSRSGFITTLVLVRDGMEVQDAIDLIREKRSPRALSMNGSSSGGVFTKLMMETPVEYWRS
jgi:hypothetical protein